MLNNKKKIRKLVNDFSDKFIKFRNGHLEFVNSLDFEKWLSKSLDIMRDETLEEVGSRVKLWKDVRYDEVLNREVEIKNPHNLCLNDVLEFITKLKNQK